MVQDNTCKKQKKNKQNTSAILVNQIKQNCVPVMDWIRSIWYSSLADRIEIRMPMKDMLLSSNQLPLHVCRSSGCWASIINHSNERKPDDTKKEKSSKQRPKQSTVAIHYTKTLFLISQLPTDQQWSSSIQNRNTEMTKIRHFRVWK